MCNWKVTFNLTFSDVIRLNILKWEMALDYLDRSSKIKKIRVRGRKEGQSEKVI